MKTKNTISLLEDYGRVEETLEKFKPDSNAYAVIKTTLDKIGAELDIFLHQEADCGETHE